MSADALRSKLNLHKFRILNILNKYKCMDETAFKLTKLNYEVTF